MKYIKIIFLFLITAAFGVQNTHAQSNEVLAKSYFLNAEKAYNKGEIAKALENLDQTVEYLGSTNARIEALYVKIALNQQDYVIAEKHLNIYFEKADEERSDYMEMLGYVAEVKERKKEKSELLNKKAKALKNLNFDNNNIAVIRLEGKYGLVDKSGREITPIKYDYIQNNNVRPPNENIFEAKLNNKYGLIDNTGKVLTPIKYDEIGDFYDGMSRVRINKKYGFINTIGKEIVPVKYDMARSFSNGTTSAIYNDTWFEIDTAGRVFETDEAGNRIN